VELVETAAPALRAKVEDLPGETGADAALGQAQVVVAAGLGVGGPENLELLRRLAAQFPNSALAGSRPVCDLGWLPYRQQVGLTGATVAPRLYIACGISGARQHTVGMQGSGFIVAISHDPQAAIFNLADVCVEEDLTAFLNAFLALA
jgi:electron transfer flavoprotein alpha subunit